MRSLIFESRKPKNSFAMDETRKPKQPESEFAQDKEKAILAGLGALTGAAAVGAAVYSHETSEENKVENAGEEGSESAVHAAQQHETTGQPGAPDNEVEVVAVESEDGALAADHVWLADEVHTVDVEGAGADVELVVDTELDGAEWNDGGVLNSDEQIINDLQGNDDVWEGPSYIPEPDGLDNTDGNACPDGTDPFLYMA